MSEECNNRIRAHNELCRFRFDIPRTSSVVQRLLRIASNGLECYSELARPNSFDAVDWKVSSFFIMSLSHLGIRIKRSCLHIFGEIVSKEFIFQLSRKCMTPSKDDRVFSAAENVCCAAISKPYQESFLLPAANNLFQGSQDSLRGANNLFRES